MAVVDAPSMGRAPTPESMKKQPRPGTPAPLPPAEHSEPEIVISQLQTDATQAGPESQLAQMTGGAQRHPRPLTEPEIETVVEMDADEPPDSDVPTAPKRRAVTADDGPSASGEVSRTASQPARTKRLSDGD
jgi:hypothetical protein